MSEWSEPFFLRRNYLIGFQHLKDAVIESPDYEGIVCPVPEAREEEYQKFVDGSSELSLSATAQGNIYVLLEPCGKRYMPSSPEVLDVGRCGAVLSVH